MKKLLFLSLALIGASVMHAATIKFDNRTGYSLNAKVFLPGGSSVPLTVQPGESTKSMSGCWVGVTFNALQTDTGIARGTRILSEKTLGIQMTCQPKTIEVTLSGNQLNAAQR